MNYSRLANVVLILVIVLSSTYAHAQQDSSTPRKANADMREKAFELLESVAGQLGTLQSAENRARLAANIVDSLWKHDEKRARALLVLVQEDINSGLEIKQSSDDKERHRFEVFSKLRTDTVERIAKYDGELALEFLKATPLRLESQLRGAVAIGEQQLELKLAKQIAANNPDLALKVGRKWLEQGFSADIIQVLAQLNKKHKEQALTFYKEVIHKLKDQDLMATWETSNFVETLARSFKPPAADEATYRELVTLIVTKALANGCGNKLNEEDERAEFCRWASSIVPQMEKIDPRGARLKRWVAEEEASEERFEVTTELGELLQNGTIDDLLALAAKNPNGAESIIYHAVQKARNDGNLEQARKLANRLPASFTRQHLLTQIEQDEEWATIDDEKLAQVQARINEIENLQHRVDSLLAVSHQLGSNNQKTALKLLTQAGEIIDTMNPGKEQTASQIALAMSYCFEKNERGFSIMDSLIPKLNELVDMAAKLDGYDTSYLRDGEWNMSANGAVGDLLTRLSEKAEIFAWCDFDRAVSLTARFDRAEIRLMAQVKLAQGILAGPPKHFRREYSIFRN